MPSASTRALASRFPGATFLEVPSDGHKLANLYEEGDETTAAIVDFFRQLGS